MSIPIHDQIQKLHACRDLYLKHDGKEHQRIETEMRLLGYHDFHRRIMYDRFERGRHHKGWIHHYGWHEELRNADCGVRIEEDAGTRRHGDAGKEEDAGTRRHGDAGKEEDAGTRRRSDAGILAKVGRVGRLNPDDTEDAADEVPASPRPSLSASSASSSVPDFEDFQTWLTHVSPSMTWDWKHQVHIYKHLKRVTDGESKRLMIFLPPRHGKSELVTVRYTAWRLKRDSKLNVIIGSYNQRLANRFSRKVRNVLRDDAVLTDRSPSFTDDGECGKVVTESADRQQIGRSTGCFAQGSGGSLVGQDSGSPAPFLPISRSRRIDTEAEWETPAGGGVRAVGAGAGVTGYGAGLIVIDDPVKSRAEAESETFREKIWDWFNDDLYTRLEPGGAIILIQTRWHEDDLAGRLLRDMKEEGAEHWDVINLPALAEGGVQSAVQSAGFSPYPTPDPMPDNDNAQEHDESCTLNEDPLEREPGEALCPERYDAAALDRLKRRLGSYSFAALYQQRPVPASGGLFKRKWFKVIDRLPPDVRNKKRGWDLGISGKDTADYTASMGVAYDRENNMYIYDGFRRQIEYPEQRRVILGRIRSEPDTEHGIELSANGTAAVQDLRRERNLRGRPVRGVKVKGDKVSRALPWIALAEEGRVHLVRGPWINDFLDEACSFPSGTHDDQIDAVSVAVQMHRERSNRLFVF